MKENKKIIKFTKLKKDLKKNKEDERITIHKLNNKNEHNSIEISNIEIDLSLKKLKQKSEGKNTNYYNKNKELQSNDYNTLDISKNLKMISFPTLPCTISSSKRRQCYLPYSKSILQHNHVICDYGNKNNNIENYNDSSKSEKDSKLSYTNLFTEPSRKKIDIDSLLITKKNIKNRIPIKKINFKKRDSKDSKVLSMDYYNAFQCIFCEQIFKETEISKLISCGHKFCNKCGEKFYEEQIKINPKNYFFKCPFIKCQKEISYNIIELLVSSKNYETLNENIVKQDNESTYRKFIFNDKERNKNKNFKDNNIRKINNQKLYSYSYSIKKNNDDICNNKYIMEINNLKSDYIFYIYSQKNFILCPSCEKNYLYRNTSKYFLKCLYCGNKFCKFCMKKLVEEHFIQENSERCKVYFRKKNNQKKSFILKFFKQIVLTIAGYLVLISFFINKIKMNYKNKCHNFNNRKIMIFFVYFIFCIFFIPFMIIIIPFYPIISCI